MISLVRSIPRLLTALGAEMATRLNLLVIRSADIDAAARFYEVLGLRFTRHSHGSGPPHYASDDPGCVFEIYPLQTGEVATASTRFGFQVESVDRMLNCLIPAGGRLISGPKHRSWGYRAVVEDLDGHHIELIQQLDSFRIEVAALGGKTEIEYAFNLAKSKPDKRTGLSNPEKRLYMTWKRGALQQFDRTLLTRAGIEHAGRLVVQFYPPDVEKTLADLEKAHAPGRSIREFLKTVFGVRPAADTWEFFVVEQTFRTMPMLRPTL